MSSIITSDSNVAEKFNRNGGVDITIGSIGGLATITTSGSFNLGTIFGTENIPYNIVVNTDAAIDITLPTSPQVIRGWRVRIILISQANTGSIRFIGASTVLGAIFSTYSNIYSVELYFIDIAPFIYLVNYFTSNSSNNIQRIIYNSNIFLNAQILSPLPIAKFFSYSGLSTSTTINGNLTGLVTIPWEVGTPGRYVDNRFYLTTVNTRIQTSRTCTMRIEACIYVNATGGATPINSVRFLLNGSTVITSQISLGTISNTSTQVIYITTPLYTSNSSNYAELQIGKTAISAGTNIVDRVNSYIFAEYIST